MIAGSASEVHAKLCKQGVRGEIVLLVAPAAQKVQNESVREALIRVHNETGLPMKQVVKQVARQFGLPGSEVYKESLQIRSTEGQ